MALLVLESSSCLLKLIIKSLFSILKVRSRSFITLHFDNERQYFCSGELLGKVETHQGHLNYAAISSCGRFFGSSGFTSDVRFFEVSFEKSNGNFKEIRKAFELKGHNAQVLCFSLNKDSTRAATISKDNTWKLWNTDVDYVHRQDPKCYFTGSLVAPIRDLGLIVLSPDALSLAMSIDNRLIFYNLTSEEKKCEQNIEEVHSGQLNFD